MEMANSIYDYTKRGPNDSIEEQYVTAKLVAAANASAAVRPPIPNIGKTPPRFGYRKTPPDIYDVLNVDDMYNPQWADWSGRVSGYQGTSFPSLNPM